MEAVTQIEPSQDHMAELLCALSYATSLGYGGRMEHGLKTAYIGLRLAEKMELPAKEREAVFYGALLKDVGCTACAAGFAPFFFDDELAPKMDFMLVDPTRISDILSWFSRSAPLDARFPARMAKLLAFAAQCSPLIKEAMAGHCEIAEMFARRLGFERHVQETVRYQWDRWDGKGLVYRLKGNEIPVASRILHMAQMGELVCNFGGAAAAVTLAKEQRGKRLDPDVADTFLEWIGQAGQAEEIEEDGMADRILGMKPGISGAMTAVLDDPVERVCEALADFIDTKCKLTWNHSREVAAVAEGIARGLGQDESFRTHVRRAALVHDIGKVGVPYGALAKAKEGLALTGEESEFIRMHPYYTHRILERVKPLRGLAEDAASHHERADGSGYYRRLAGSQVSLGGRVIGLANEYANRLRKTMDKRDPEEVLQELKPLAGSHFDAEVYEGLCNHIRGARPAASKSPSQEKKTDAHGLSDRELEVLQLAATGMKNPDIAGRLFISRKTVEHHLTHIYNKLGVTCRTSAVAFVLQHQLLLIHPSHAATGAIERTP